MLVPGGDQAFPRKNFQCLVLITHFCNIAGILKKCRHVKFFAVSII